MIHHTSIAWLGVSSHLSVAGLCGACSCVCSAGRCTGSWTTWDVFSYTAGNWEASLALSRGKTPKCRKMGQSSLHAHFTASAGFTHFCFCSIGQSKSHCPDSESGEIDSTSVWEKQQDHVTQRQGLQGRHLWLYCRLLMLWEAVMHPEPLWSPICFICPQDAQSYLGIMKSRGIWGRVMKRMLEMTREEAIFQGGFLLWPHFLATQISSTSLSFCLLIWAEVRGMPWIQASFFQCYGAGIL